VVADTALVSCAAWARAPPHRQGPQANGDNLVAEIADEVFAQKKYLPPHPTGV